MENLDWLEWYPVTSPLTFKVIQHGVFPENVTTVELSRDAELKLIAIGKGRGEFWLDEHIKLQPGESASEFYRQETIGITKCGYTVRLMGVFIVLNQMKSQALKLEDTDTLFVKALVSEAKVIKTDFTVYTHIEWIVNFLNDDYIFPRGTKREKSIILKITREGSDNDLTHYNLTESGRSILDHFRCECTLNNQKWSLIVGKVIEEVAPKKYNPGFVEFDNLKGDKLPSEDTKQNILAALSFALGRQLISVGSTSLSQNSDCIGFNAKEIYLLENNAYTKSSLPPIPLKISDKNIILDEKKISRIISAVSPIWNPLILSLHYLFFGQV